MWLPLFVYGKLLTLKMRKNALKIPTRLFEDAYLGQVSGSHLPSWASVSSSAELNGLDSKVTSGLKKSLLVLFLYGRISWVFIELDLELCCTSRSQHLTCREGIKREKERSNCFLPSFHLTMAFRIRGQCGFSPCWRRCVCVGRADMR